MPYTELLKSGERQKKYLQSLKDLAVSQKLQTGVRTKDNLHVESRLHDITPGQDIVRTQEPYLHRPVLPVTESLSDSIDTPNQSCLSSCGSTPFQASTIFSTPETSHESNILDRLLEQEGISRDQLDSLRLLGDSMALQTIFKAGVEALLKETYAKRSTAHLSLDEEKGVTKSPELRTDKILVLKNANAECTTSITDVRNKNTRIKQAAYVAAGIANAQCLGFSLEFIHGNDSCNDDAESPFFREGITEAAAKTACLDGFKQIPKDLRPTVTQMMNKHHPYIDVPPFPTFRDRIIKLAYGDEPMINEDELCEDLENEGLICWGSSSGCGKMATGSGAPWDARSWEAQPWFMKKWWILVGGAEGEIYHQTKWWAEMRGERFCDPW